MASAAAYLHRRFVDPDFQLPQACTSVRSPMLAVLLPFSLYSTLYTTRDMKPFSHPWGTLTGLPLQLTATVGSCAGFYLFGYDQGVANALAQSPHFAATFSSLFASPTILGVVFATFVFGAWLGCLIASFIGNSLGRRTVLFVSAVGTLIGGGLQAGSVNLGMFVFARTLNGLAVGIMTAVVPPYIGELSKPNVRGLMMSLELVFASAGLMTAFIVAFAFQNEAGAIGWRIPLAIQSILVLITLVALLFSPESPRWLMERGRVEEGREILERLHGAAYAAEVTLEIQRAIALEHSVARPGWSAVFENNPQRFRYRTLLAIGSNFLQQATGINMATYYAGTIFATAIGLDGRQVGLTLVGLGISGLAFTLVGCFWSMEHLGRVKTAMIGSAGCCLGQAFIAGGVANVEHKAGAYVAATGLFLFLGFFSYSWLPVGFIYGAEVTPLAIRAKATPLAISVQYIMNAMVVLVTPVGIESLGYRYYIPFCVANAVTVPVVWWFAPEVAGLSLEGVDELFGGDKIIMRRSPREPVGHALLDAALHGKDEEKATHSFDEVATGRSG